MRLYRIHIESFGRWKHQTWEADEKSTLFFGWNEAGKSTILSFIESVFFGFTVSTEARSAGSLQFVGKDGSIWLLERRQGRTKSGDLRITKDGQTVKEEEFFQGMTRKSFQLTCRVDLDQLQRMDDLSPDDMNRMLLDTSLAGIAPVLQRSEALRKEGEKLFKPRGQKAEANRTAVSLDELAASISRWEDKLDEYKLLNQRKDTISTRMAQIDEEAASLRTKQEEAETAVRTAALYTRWKEEKELLEKEPRLPSHARREMETIEEIIQELSEEKAVVKEQFPDISAPSLTKEEAAQLERLHEDASHFHMCLQQYDEAGSELELLQDKEEDLQKPLPEKIDLTVSTAGSAAREQLQRLFDQKDQLKKQEQEMEKRPKTLPVSNAARTVLILPYVLLAAALLFGDWTGALFLAALAGTITLLRRSLFTFHDSEMAGLKRSWDQFYEEVDEWCRKSGLPPGWDLTEYREAVSMLETASGILDQRRYHERKRQTASAWMDEYRQQADAFLPPGTSSADVPAYVKQRWEDSKQEEKTFTQLVERRDWLQERQHEIETKIAFREAQKQDWLEKAGTDEDHFWAVVEEAEALRERQAEVRDIWTRICTLIPVESQRTRVLQLIDEDQMPSPENIHEQQTALAAEREKLVKEETSISLSLKEMEEEGTYEKIRQQYTTEKRLLDDLLERWMVIEAAQALTTTLRKRYEEEKQPAVLQRAADRFARMTEYKQITAGPDDGQFTVHRSDGVSFQPEELSRGTKELLYLSLRLALVEENPVLPLFMDEALVNMDAPRRAALWKELADLPVQMLFFTCHEHLQEEWREAASGREYLL
ncbi:ATP-binding protein [Alkalicoccus chagannorensis]|uniref:ATP-binding protein n=1 Tax=Alkalicoccus chagannorensis TaxID=427072 RepID=UPI000406D638|nr:AAA family ATPase [Alkalicoccus chagannorensis]